MVCIRKLLALHAHFSVGLVDEGLNSVLLLEQFCILLGPNEEFIKA